MTNAQLDQLRTFFNTIVSLPEADWKRTQPLFRSLYISKGEHILREGEVCRYL